MRSIEEPLVSVVIPCYNVEQYVEECVASVLSQSYPRIEIICVDDGSLDKTLTALRYLAASHEGKINVLTGPNRGASAARNRGLAAAHGHYIQFLDADDLLDARKIEHQIALIRAAETPPDLIIANFKKTFVDRAELIIEAEKPDPWIGLIKTRLGITSSNLWCASLLREVGAWNEHLASSQEAELMFRLLQRKTNVIYDDACLTVVRRREGSISTTDQEINWKRYIQLRRDILTFLRENDLLTPERESAAYEMLFLAVRALYGYDRESARSLYQGLIPDDYTPTRYTRLYAYCFKLLGFEKTERLRALLGGRGL